MVARVLEIGAIPGADQIRRVMVDAGAASRSKSCAGPGTSSRVTSCPWPRWGRAARWVRDRPAEDEGGRLQRDAVLGRELELSDDHDGHPRLVASVASGPAGGSTGPGPDAGSAWSKPWGSSPTTVFDIAVEANRPDAWCMAGVARDLAARLAAALHPARPPGPVGRRARHRWRRLSAVEVVDDDLCPRFTARVSDRGRGALPAGWPGG